MKYVILSLLLTVLACSKSDDADPSNNLLGIWRLTTYCNPISSSACTTVVVPSDKGVFITFGNNGTFNESYENTKPSDYAFLGCGSGDYNLEGDNIRIRALCMSSIQGRLMKVVSVSANRLVLNPFDVGEYSFVR